MLIIIISFEQICKLAYWIFDSKRRLPGYGRPDIKLFKNPCGNLWYGKFPGYGNSSGFGSKHHTKYTIKPPE